MRVYTSELEKMGGERKHGITPSKWLIGIFWNISRALSENTDKTEKVFNPNYEITTLFLKPYQPFDKNLCLKHRRQ